MTTIRKKFKALVPKEPVMCVRECDDCLCKFLAPTGYSSESCFVCDAIANDRSYEECNDCGKVLVCATEEMFNAHPDRKNAHDEDGNWFCPKCLGK